MSLVWNCLDESDDEWRTVSRTASLYLSTRVLLLDVWTELNFVTTLEE